MKWRIRGNVEQVLRKHNIRYQRESLEANQATAKGQEIFPGRSHPSSGPGSQFAWRISTKTKSR